VDSCYYGNNDILDDFISKDKKRKILIYIFHAIKKKEAQTCYLCNRIVRLKNVHSFDVIVHGERKSCCIAPLLGGSEH